MRVRGKADPARLEALEAGITLSSVAYGPFQLGDLERGAVEEVPRRVLREQLGASAPAKAKRHADHRR